MVGERACVLAATSGDVVILVRLVCRRAFHELMQHKGWDVADIVMEEAAVSVAPE